MNKIPKLISNLVLITLISVTAVSRVNAQNVPPSASLKISQASPITKTVAVDQSGSASNMVVSVFSLKANTNSYLDHVYVNLLSSTSPEYSGRVRSSYLFRGSTVVAKGNVLNNVIFFENIKDFSLPANATVDLTLQVSVDSVGTNKGMVLIPVVDSRNVGLFEYGSGQKLNVAGAAVAMTTYFVNYNGVYVDSASTTLSSPTFSNNMPVAYSGDFTFTINNTGNSEIYFTKDPNYLLKFSTTSAPAQIIMPELTVIPSQISGDRQNYYLVPAGASRKVNVPFILKNTGGTTGYKIAKVTGISYVDPSTSPADRLIQNDLRGLSASVVLDGTSSSTQPFLNVISPVGDRTYQFGSPIYLSWIVGGTNVDYYYALLENTAIKNFGVVVTPNLSPATTSASFVFNSNILNTFLANGGGLTESQLKNGYYVRVVGIKRGIIWNSAVVNGRSGTFSVSTTENAKGITVSNTQARMNNPVISGNVAIAYPVNFIFTVNNYSNDAIYLSTDPKYVTRIEYNSQTPSDVRFNSISTPNGLISGDNNKSYVVPVGTSRSFNVSAVLRNYSGVTEQRIVKVVAIQYLRNQNSQSFDSVREGLEGLKVYPMMDGVATTTVATTTSPSTGTSTSSINSGKKLGSLVASNANARLGSAIYKNNEIYAYNFTMTVKLSNVGDGPAYIRNKNDGTDTYAYINPSTATVKYIRDVSPALLSGDTNSALIIPAGSSRMVTYQGTITNFGSPSLVVYSITGIRYGTSTASLDNTLSAGLESMKISSTLGVTKATLPVVTAAPVYTTSPAVSTTPRVTSSVTPVPTTTYSPTPVPTTTYSPTPVPTSTYYPSTTPVPTTTYSPTPAPTVISTPIPSSTPVYSPTPTGTPTPSASSSPRGSTSPSPSTSPISGDFGRINQASVWTSILNIIFGNL